MRRPAATLEALGRSPLVKARQADASRVERVPEMAAGTRPHVILSRRPAAERATDARPGGVETFLLIRLAINNNRLVILNSAHARYYDSVQMHVRISSQSFKS